MSDRAERAFQRVRRSNGTVGAYGAGVAAGIDAYEAELRADLDSDELVERALAANINDTVGVNDFGDPYFRELQPELMRKVLDEVLR